MEKLIELCNINAVSANEEKLAEFISNELKDYADEIIIDSIGNVIVHKKGTGQKLMLCAEMDEPGGVVTYVSDDKVYFNFVGEINCESIVNMTVEFPNGKKGVVCIENQKKASELKSTDLYVDMCGETAEIADAFSIVYEPVIGKNSAIAKAGAIRSGVYALMETVKLLDETKNDVYAVFASRGQVGFKGAKAAANRIAPRYCVCIGECEEEKNVKCGNGFAISLKGNNSIADVEFVKFVKDISLKNNIAHTDKVSADGMYAGGVVKCCGEGVKVLDILIPQKYKTAPRQYINFNDNKALVDVLKKICEEELNF